jgi:hypothetical protein
MQPLAKSDKPKLADQYYRLDAQFRPEIPEGIKGWHAKGNLDLGSRTDEAERVKL